MEHHYLPGYTPHTVSSVRSTVQVASLNLWEREQYELRNIAIIRWHSQQLHERDNSAWPTGTEVERRVYFYSVGVRETQGRLLLLAL